MRCFIVIALLSLISACAPSGARLAPAASASSAPAPPELVTSFRAPAAVEESFASRTARTLDDGRVRQLDAFIEESLTKTKVPGAAIAIVQNGKVVHERGFGAREVGKTPVVTAETLFMIGSTTKSLTTSMMAKLVDDGKLRWETRVKDLWPSFSLEDSDVTQRLLVEHTVCGCAGLPRQDYIFLFEYAGKRPEDRVALLPSMQPTTPLGATFQYSNLMFAAGGFFAAHAANPSKDLGAAYDEAMQDAIFEPLGMTSTTLDFAVATLREHAIPHAKDMSGEYLPTSIAEEESVVSVRPAGGIWSSAHDMARYLAFELAMGKNARGDQVVSESNLTRRWKPQTKINDKSAYGLGMMIENDHNAKVLTHGGNNLGFTSDMFFLPEGGVGVVLLMNGGQANAVRSAVRRRTMELLFDGNDEAARGLEFEVARMREESAQALARRRPADPAWLSGVAGTYRNASLGKVVVRPDGVLDAGEWRSTFGKEIRPDGATRLVLLTPPWAGMIFRPDRRDGVDRLVVGEAQEFYTLSRALR